MRTISVQGKKLSYPKANLLTAALFLALLPLSSLFSASTVYSTATANFTLNTSTIQVASIAASSSISMNVTTATAGQSPDTVSDATTAYGLSTNTSTALTVSGAQIPTGVIFQLLFSPNNSQTTSGLIALQNGSSNYGTVSIFPSISPGIYSGTVTYYLGAPITKAPLTSQSFQLTYKIA